eukprot:g4374.t1
MLRVAMSHRRMSRFFASQAESIWRSLELCRSLPQRMPPQLPFKEAPLWKRLAEPMWPTFQSQSDWLIEFREALVWGTTVDFCSNQAHKMSVQSFAPNRIMVLYSDKATGSETAESFGNSVLADIGSIGEISLLGNFRFTDSAVARLEAAKVSKNGFVLAARASPAVDDMNPTPVKQEAMAMYGELVGDDLVFDPNPVNLEPGQVWARGLSLIAPNTLAYAYQDASILA